MSIHRGTYFQHQSLQGAPYHHLFILVTVPVAPRLSLLTICS
ncbi:hypothetical protein VPHPS32B4_0059 [Vibrio phage PS32B-4]